LDSPDDGLLCLLNVYDLCRECGFTWIYLAGFNSVVLSNQSSNFVYYVLHELFLRQEQISFCFKILVHVIQPSLYTKRWYTWDLLIGLPFYFLRTVVTSFYFCLCSASWMHIYITLDYISSCQLRGIWSSSNVWTGLHFARHSDEKT
jgi:hypothetical protein